MSRRRDSKNDEAPAPIRLTDAVAARLWSWAEEAASAYELALYDVDAHPTWLLQITVDRANAEPGNGVTVDECAAVSRYLEALLDNDADVWPSYTLEVSSPGIERKLTKPRHFELSLGRTARIVVHNAIDSRNVFDGELQDFDGDVVTLNTADGPVSIPRDNIARARLTFDFPE